jgi:dihydroorotase-like cyclic amidohydrolase
VRGTPPGVPAAAGVLGCRHAAPPRSPAAETQAIARPVRCASRLMGTTCACSTGREDASEAWNACQR